MRTRTQNRPVFLFAPDAGGNGGKEEDVKPPVADAKAPAGDQKAPGLASYTQAQLDEMFADRAKRGGESAITDLLRKLGVDSVDTLSGVFTEGKKLLDGQKTEVEKLQAELGQAKKQAQVLSEEKEKAEALALEKLMRAAVTTEAMGQGFRPEAIKDVWLVVDREKITEKDGDFTGVKEAVDTVAKSKPFWLGSDKSSPQRGTPPGSPPRKKADGDDGENKRSVTVKSL